MIPKVIALTITPRGHPQEKPEREYNYSSDLAVSEEKIP